MKVLVNLSSPEQHPTSWMPKAMRELWYRNNGLLDLIEPHGCPNNGCEHTFYFSGERADVVAWLDLFVDAYPLVLPDIHVIKERIHKAFVYGTDCAVNGNFKIKLKSIMREVEYNGETLTRPWFWAPFWEESNV